MTETANNQLLSNEEEAALQDGLFEDIKTHRLTRVLEIIKDRDWPSALAIHRIKTLIESGRVGYAANPDSTILYARSPFPRTPRDEEIDQMKQTLLGLTLTDIEAKNDDQGDQYTRFVFGDRFYQFLAHFTANDHQVAVAKEALQKIVDNSGFDGIAAKVAKDALEKMETFKNGR
jgi:hypothetical protein